MISVCVSLPGKPWLVYAAEHKLSCLISLGSGLKTQQDSQASLTCRTPVNRYSQLITICFRLCTRQQCLRLLRMWWTNLRSLFCLLWSKNFPLDFMLRRLACLLANVACFTEATVSSWKTWHWLEKIVCYSWKNEAMEFLTTSFTGGLSEW